MDRNKKGSSEELAVVKAAAWAWYEHGSGSEGKPIHEFDITRRRRPPQPSRYKLEATSSTAATYNIEDEEEVSASSHNINSLLDTYEIQRISQQLDYLILSSTPKVDDDQHHKNTDTKKNKKKGKAAGFWLWPAALICGTREDVVETRLVRVLRNQAQPAGNCVAIVRLANCRPRAAHA